MTSSAAFLEIKDLIVSYGRIRALNGVNLTVGRGEIVALLGSNGAGKTSTLRALSGLVRAESGSIKFEGQEILGRSAHEIVQLGISHVPEGRRIFATLSVEENLALGAYLIRRHHAEVRSRRDRVYDLFPQIAQRRHQLAGLLSGGEQQMLAVGRALMSEPRLLALDEPSLGLSPRLSAQILRLVARSVTTGLAVLLVEQNVRQALRVAHRAYVLETGAVTLSGNAVDLERDERVVRAYLGGLVGARP